jgi:hypothetical protein
MSQLPESPFQSIYQRPLNELIAGIDSLELLNIDTISHWVKSAYEASKPPEEKEATVKLDYFEPHVLSVVSLALSAKDGLKQIDPNFEPSEVDDLASLLLALSLLRRAAKKSVVPVSSDPEGEAIAKRRQWSTLADAIADLKEYEGRLVKKGRLVLRKNATLRNEWEADTDDGTFTDAAGDVRRRLDFVGDHKDLFQGGVVTPKLLEEGELLHREGNVFFRGREGRSIPKEQLTLYRDWALTMLIPALEEIQPLLVESYEGNEQALSKLEGDFWKQLNKLSKPRRPRK